MLRSLAAALVAAFFVSGCAVSPTVQPVVSAPSAPDVCSNPLASVDADLQANVPNLESRDVPASLLPQAVAVYNRMPPPSDETADAARVYSAPGKPSLLLLIRGGCVVGSLLVPPEIGQKLVTPAGLGI